MSKAIICDRCKGAFAEQACTHIETSRQFIRTIYDLCPKCADEFRSFMNDQRKVAQE